MSGIGKQAPLTKQPAMIRAWQQCTPSAMKCEPTWPRSTSELVACSHPPTIDRAKEAGKGLISGHEDCTS